MINSKKKLESSIIMLHLYSEFIACFFAVLTFRKADAFSKVIIVQVCIALIVEIIGGQIIRSHQNTTWLYNCYMPLEVSLLFTATFLHYSNHLRYQMIAILACYWLCWVVEINFNSIEMFAIKTYVVGAIILLVSYFFVLYKSTQSRVALYRQSRFWFAIGIILFFGCNIPFFSMHEYIVRYSTPSQLNILEVLMTTFAHIRYLCMAIGFIIVFREAKKNEQKNIAYGK